MGMRQSLDSPDEEMLSEHPDGCMCEECRIDRGEIPPKSKPGRPRKPSPAQQPQNGGRERFLTPPVNNPRDPHALYEYERGELRRCHLCGDVGSHLSFTSEETWFATLEDRARHILECHTDEADPIVKRERQRSKEILGIAEIWNSHSYGKQVNFKKGLKEEYTAPVQMMQQQSSNPVKSLFSPKQPKPMGAPSKGSWFSRNKLITAVLVIAALYGLYYLYLLSQGYE
jgi:hypothetical protein